jgi:hypothetical protein
VSDDVFRALERRVAENDATAADRLHLARLLERAGRGDDALAVLLPARADPDVASVLATFPAWSCADGDTGRTRAVDVAPIRGAPRLAWESSTGKLPALTHLAASPLGLLALTAGNGLGVFDPVDGKLRFALERHVAVGGRLEGTRLLWLSRDAHAHATALSSGEELAKTDEIVPRVPWTETVAFASAAFAGGTGAPRAMTDPARRPWRIGLADVPQNLILGATTEHHAYFVGYGRTAAFDRRTGREGAVVDGVRPIADARGLVTHGRNGLQLYDATGTYRAWGTGETRAVALTPAHVVVSHEGMLGLVSRETAAHRALGIAASRPTQVAIARDVLYATPGLELHAIDLASGERLWSIDRKRLHALVNPSFRLRAIVAASRRIYAILARSSGSSLSTAIACFE